MVMLLPAMAIKWSENKVSSWLGLRICSYAASAQPPIAAASRPTQRNVRRISQQGSLKWNGERTFVSEFFASQWMGLRALDERYYEVLYGLVTIGFLDTSSTCFIAP